MQNITQEVFNGTPRGYDVFWGVAQSAVVIFRQETVVEVLPLERNDEGAAVRAAKIWFENH